MLQRLRAWLRQRRAAALAAELPASQWLRVEARLPFLGHLAAPERLQLRQLALEFLAAKQMSGAQGLRLNGDMQLSIALQACLPILHHGLEWYEGWLGVVVYPGDFVIPREEIDEDGVVHEYDDAVIGEAWADGPVLLSWFDDVADADGANVVIHEFAHKLDMRNGDADGLPPLPAGMSRDAWREAFAPAFEHFRACVDGGAATALDPYGAEAPAEFFAVMSEAFFETPLVLRDEYPQVYRQLCRFYRQDPAAAPPVE